MTDTFTRCGCCLSHASNQHKLRSGKENDVKRILFPRRPLYRPIALTWYFQRRNISSIHILWLWEHSSGYKDDWLMADWIMSSHRHNILVYLIHINLTKNCLLSKLFYKTDYTVKITWCIVMLTSITQWSNTAPGSAIQSLIKRSLRINEHNL